MYALPRRLVAVLLILTATAVAQSDASNWNTVMALTPGTDVRITTGSLTFNGRIDRITDASIAVTSGKNQKMFTRQEVSRVSVRKPGHRVRNALIGLGIGAGAGLGIGLGTTSCSGIGCIGSGAIKVAAPLALAFVGAAIGAVIPSGGWREVYKK